MIVEIIAKVVSGVVLVLGMAVAIALFISLPVMWLWDAVMPELFGLKAITWTQALWLALLCSLLFKSSTSKSKD